MKKQLFYLTLISLLLYNCKQPVTKSEKVWVYMEFEIITQKDTTAEYLYLYGQIEKSTIKKINLEKYKNYLFELTDARYVGDDDEVLIYADDVDEGVLFYRIKDIASFELLKKDPLLSDNKQSKKKQLDSVQQ